MRQQRAYIASASVEQRRLLLEENRLREQREQRELEEKKLHEQQSEPGSFAEQPAHLGVGMDEVQG